MHSTSQKFGLDVVCIHKKAWNFSTEFLYSGQLFSRNIFTLLNVKAETFVHAHFAITLLYILLANILVSVGNLHQRNPLTNWVELLTKFVTS